METNTTATFSISSYSPINILELKEWVDKQVSEGKTRLDLDVEWGYYDDVEGFNLIANK